MSIMQLSNKQLITPPSAKIEHKKPKLRNSNIEFLRIVAMFMVLMLHVNFFSIGSPDTEVCLSQPVQSFLRIAFEMLCIISVNLFVFISGWFGIKANFKGFCKFIFQCFCVLAIVQCIGFVFGYTQISVDRILEIFFLKGNAWFVPAYAFLYILSPVLNVFCEKSSEKTIKHFVIVFYLLQTIYDNIFDSAHYILYGHSPFSFIGIYILARYVKMYGERWYKYGLKIFIVSSMLLIALYCIPKFLNIYPILSLIAIRYTCLLNISAIIGLVIWVANLSPRHNKIVNFIATSVFAVYLCHVCLHWTIVEYKRISCAIFNEYSGLSYLAVITLFMLSVFCASILIDQIRKYAWKVFSKHVVDRIHV